MTSTAHVCSRKLRHRNLANEIGEKKRQTRDTSEYKGDQEFAHTVPLAAPHKKAAWDAFILSLAAAFNPSYSHQ
jgi:hypothetical protein